MLCRVRRFRRYECCFKGTDAVKWLVSNDKAATSEEAVMLGNDMLRAGLLHHVSFKRQFQDKDSLYRYVCPCMVLSILLHCQVQLTPDSSCCLTFLLSGNLVSTSRGSLTARHIMCDVYRFLDVGEASDVDDSSCTQSPKPERSEVLEPCNEDYDK